MRFLRQTLFIAFISASLLTLPSCAQESGGNSSSKAEAPELVQADTTADPSGINWVSLEEAQAQAVETGKKVLIFGYADWCPYCMRMRKETYTNQQVRNALYTEFIPVELNAEAEKEVVFNGESFKSHELAQYFRLSSFPTHYFIDTDGTILGAQPGFFPPDIFAPLISYVGQDQFGKIEFEEFLKQKENIVIEEKGSL